VIKALPAKILPGTGRGTMRSMVEGAHAHGGPNPFVMNRFVRRWAPTTTTLRVAVPLPVPGRN
jgi:hypothetical protein